MDLNIYKVDLDTDQPNGGKGESPRSAFTKYNNSLDTINDELTTLDDSAMKKADNLSGLTDKKTARNNLGLGGAATRNVGTSSGQLMEVGAFGIGTSFGIQVFDANAIADTMLNKSGFYPYMSNLGSVNVPHDYVYIQHLFYGGSGNCTQIAYSYVADSIWLRHRYSGVWSSWKTFYHSGNTIVDSNGFIKAASPIVKLFSNSLEKTEHLEIAETEFERLGVGHYVLHNVPSLSKDGWYIETPKDRNNNIYFYLDYVKDEDNNTLTIKTYEPDYSTGRATAGEPVDILEGRFVSLRFEEDPSLYPELEEPKTEEEYKDKNGASD